MWRNIRLCLQHLTFKFTVSSGKPAGRVQSRTTAKGELSVSGVGMKAPAKPGIAVHTCAIALPY